jgi:dissimilatory sulfite reductase (desulfoviridin) alpha/beta subunit
MSTSFKLRNGTVLLSTEAPGGIYNTAQLAKIAALCDADAAIVKATEDQRLALFVPEAKARETADALKTVGLGVRHYQDGLHQPVACIGALCNESLQDALGAAMDVTRELSRITLGTSLRIGINGCARACVPTHTLDISIIGETNGYRISLGGKNTQIPEMASFMAEGVPAAKLPKLLQMVVSVYKDLAQKDETLQDVMERCGSTKFIEALAPYSQDAHQEDPFAGVSGNETTDEDIKIDDLPDSGAMDEPQVDFAFAEELSADAGESIDDIRAGTADGGEESFVAAADGDENFDAQFLADNTPALAPEPATTVAAAPAAKADVEVSSDEFDAGEVEEVGEDQADAFEEQLNASIEEEESVPVIEDENSDDRLEAMRLVEASAELPTVEAVHESLDVDDSFENLQIDHDVEDLSHIENEEIAFEADDIQPETFAAPVGADLGDVTPMTTSSSKGSPEFSGVDYSAGRVSISFSTGAMVQVDTKTIRSGAPRQIVAFGKRITIAQQAAGVNVDVDGVGIFLPGRAA